MGSRDQHDSPLESEGEGKQRRRLSHVTGRISRREWTNALETRMQAQ